MQPSPSAPDRVAGRLAGEWDGRALARCRTAAQEGTKRALAPVPLRVGVGRGRRSAAARGSCATSATARRPRRPARAATSAIPSLRARAAAAARAARGVARRRASSRSGRSPPATSADLDEAILETVAAAQPEVGRTRAVEVLRGGRSKVVAKYSYDGLPHYGAYGHLRADAVLERVDALLAAGTLRSTGGRFPKLEVA